MSLPNWARNCLRLPPAKWTTTIGASRGFQPECLLRRTFEVRTGSSTEMLNVNHSRPVLSQKADATMTDLSAGAPSIKDLAPGPRAERRLDLVERDCRTCPPVQGCRPNDVSGRRLARRAHSGRPARRFAQGFEPEPPRQRRELPSRLDVKSPIGLTREVWPMTPSQRFLRFAADCQSMAMFKRDAQSKPRRDEGFRE
jgi:hypothetical protein